MPHYVAEFDHGGHEIEHHDADGEHQVRLYYEIEMPWVLPVLITRMPDEDEEL